MKRHEEEKLLNEIIAGEEISEFRRASLARGLQAVQQRRRRRLLRAGALAALPVLLAAGLIFSRAHRPVPAGNRVEPVRPAPAASVPVKFITDEELFALFPGQPMALIGPAGRQELVFLDRAPHY